MISKFLRPRSSQALANWTPSLAIWSSVGLVGMVWMTNWKLVLQYVPWIKGKFKKDD